VVQVEGVAGVVLVLDGGKPGQPPGLLFGYAGLSEPAIAEGIALLARAISDLSG
jgi:hypothetical protein